MNGDEEVLTPAEDVAPPVFDDGSEEIDGEGEVGESTDVGESYGPHPEIPRGRGRPRRHKKAYTPGYVPVPPNHAPLPWEDKSLEWDGWCNAFAWGKDPTLRFILKRLAPERGANGLMISGVLETREGTPCLLEEIRTTYAGGVYEATITGIHPLTQDNTPRVLSRKRTQLPGPPNPMDGALPRTALSARGGSAESPIARTAMDMMKGEFEAMRRSRDDSPRIVEKTLATVQQVSEQRARFAETSAESRIKAVNEQLEDARKRNHELEDRLRNAESEMMRKAAENQERLTEAVQGAQNGSMAILTQLLPTLTGGAADQVKQMALMYQGREERQAAEYKSIIQQMQSNFQSQMEARQTLFLVQLETTKGQYESTIGMLRQELQTARADVASLQRRIEELRTALDTKNQELITRTLDSRVGKSPVEQMTELGTMFETMETMKGLFGGGRAPDDLDEIENPLTRKLLKMGEGAVQHLPAILQALKPGGPQPMPQPMPPMLQQPMMQPQPQPQRRPVPAPVPAPAPSAPRVRKEDVATALEFIANVITAGGDTPTPVEAVARTAVAQADNTVLRALSSRKPESVIAQLEAQGMLHGPLLEEKGKAYLVELLGALKKQLSSDTVS
jgi:hypothetical protein